MVGRGMAVLAFGVAVTVSVGACGHAGPSRRNVLPEAYLVYPGAKEVNRIWTPEETGSGIDGNDLSHGASLDLYYRVPPGTRKAAVDTWYDQRLLAAGWRLHADTGAFRTYVKQVGPRFHWYHLTTHDTEEVADFKIDYQIG